MRATFFVVAGHNSTPARRLLRRDYRRRLLRLGPRALLALRRSPWRREGFLEAPAARERVRRILDAGHEIAVHGFDHAWWADHAWQAEPAQLTSEIDRAYDAMAAVTGRCDLGWGSPSWRTTPAVLRHLALRRVPYVSDCWGRGPFRAAAEDGTPIALPHLAISAPALESLVLHDRVEPRCAVEAVAAALRPGAFDVVCCHDYFEGLLHPGLFAALLAAIAGRGLRTVTLAEAASALAPQLDRLPVHRLRRGPLPGFSGEVSWQDVRS
jgi:peptidoglycan/xylan/chitin deacetylase (PgdA/CDA1 family)